MKRQCRVVGVGLWLSLAIGSQALATPILPGYDHLCAQPGAMWEFFPPNEIEAGFFGPGSDPFEGQVGYYTVTNIWRTLGADFLTGPVQIPTEIVAMSLHSVEPIKVTYDGGAVESFFDVFLTIEPSRPSLGEYTLTHNAAGDPDGGFLIDSFFDVFFDIVFKPAEFSPPPDGNMEPRHLYREQLLTLAGPVPWSHTGPRSYLHPDSGGFLLGFDPSVMPPPDDSMPAPVTYVGSEFTWVVRLAPVPEPGTLALLALGLTALARRRRKR